MVKMGIEKKKELLIENFEVLRKEPDKNDAGLAKVIEKMLKSIGYYDIGFEMLKWVIKNAERPRECLRFYLYTKDSESRLKLAFGKFLLDSEVKVSLAKLYKKMKGDVNPFGYEPIIVTLFKNKKYDDAYNILSYYADSFLLESEWDSREWGRVFLLKSTIDFMEEDMQCKIDEQMIEVLLSCIEKIDNENYRSMLTTMLVDYM